jgi:AcrR family transcriptional regulator
VIRIIKQLERTYVNLNGEPIKNETKNNIVDVAIHLFSHHGYRGVSIRDITREVGIKESSLYKHFQSKEEILRTIFVNFSREVVKILPPQEHLDDIVSSMNPQAFLEQGLRNYQLHIENLTMRRIWRIIYLEMFCNAMARDIYYNQIINKIIDCLDLVFAKMIEAGKLKRLDPRLLAIEYQYPVFTMMMEYNLLMFEDKPIEVVERRLKEHIVFFVNATAP